MTKFIFFIGLLLLVQSDLLAQCLSQPLCPTALQTICDTTTNNNFYWNSSTPSFDSPAPFQDIHEVLTDLSMQIVDSCGIGEVQVSFVLFLDLNSNGIRETVISSSILPTAGMISYGNFNNPNYGGSATWAFDNRPVSTNEKYKFVLEKTVQGSLVTAKVRWITALNPNDYLLPELPAGTHRIEWRFEKNGEVKTCGYNFLVKDCQPPIVVCKNHLEITSYSFVATIQLWVNDLIESGSDNITLTDRLTYSVRRPGTGTGFPLDANGQPIISVIVDCDFNVQHYEVWARDLAGNSSYCEASVYLHGDCEGDMGIPQIKIDVCAIDHCHGEGIEGVGFSVQGSAPGLPPLSWFDLSDTIHPGCISWNNIVPVASNFTITLSKDNNPLNGVTTYDLALISKHILGVQPLASPYKLIAADVNKSGSITAFDIVELRKLILGIYQKLPNNTSWRFVDTSFVFPNPNNPFQTVFPESISITNIQNGISNRFYGIKIGDVNCNAQANIGQTPDEEALTIPDLHLKTNDVVEVPVRFSQANGYQGFQFGLHFDPAQMELLEVIPQVGTKDNFGLFADHVNVSWSEANPAVFLPDEPVFYLRIKALAPLHLGEVFSLSTEKLHAEAYTESDTPIDLRLQFASATNTADINTEPKIFDPAPNPTTTGVRIPLRLEESETVVVELLDINGRLIYQQEQVKSAGAQLIEIPAIDFPQAGLYIWRVQTGGVSRSGKIVKQ